MDANLSEPIDTGSYQLIASTTGTWELFDSDTIEVPDMDDSGILLLRPGETSGINTLIALGHEDIDDLDEIRALAIPETTVGSGDLLVFELRAAGVNGELTPRGTGATILENGAGLDRSVSEDESSANRDAYSLNLTPRGTYIVPDAENDTYYVVVETATAITSSGDLETGSYEATVEITGDYNDRYGPLDNSTPFEYRPRSASFVGVENDVVPIPATDGATVSVETNLAPGRSIGDMISLHGCRYN